MPCTFETRIGMTSGNRFLVTLFFLLLIFLDALVKRFVRQDGVTNFVLPTVWRLYRMVCAVAIYAIPTQLPDYGVIAFASLEGRRLVETTEFSYLRC